MEKRTHRKGRENGGHLRALQSVEELQQGLRRKGQCDRVRYQVRAGKGGGEQLARLHSPAVGALAFLKIPPMGLLGPGTDEGAAISPMPPAAVLAGTDEGAAIIPVPPAAVLAGTDEGAAIIPMRAAAMGGGGRGSEWKSTRTCRVELNLPCAHSMRDGMGEL